MTEYLEKIISKKMILELIQSSPMLKHVKILFKRVQDGMLSPLQLEKNTINLELVLKKFTFCHTIALNNRFRAVTKFHISTTSFDFFIDTLVNEVLSLFKTEMENE